MGRVHGAPKLSRAALPALAAAGAAALAGTAFRVVPTAEGAWRGILDPPGLASVALALAAALALTALFARFAAPVSRPFLALSCALLPLLPVLAGRLPVLLAFQGRALLLVAAAATAVAVARAAAGRLVPSTGRREPRGAVLFALALGFYALLGLCLPGPAGPQGDEPHYLVMAQSLLRDGDLDLADELRNREYRSFFAGELEAHASPASPAGRLYPVHAPGLPLLILPAFALAGYPGARLLVAALAAAAGVLVHRLVREVTGEPGLALGVWAAAVFTPPLPFFALAIYPETPAALAGAVFLLTSRRDPGRAGLAAAACAAAALPWLHPKLLPLAALGLGLTLLRRVGWPARLLAAAPLLVSVAALLVFFERLYGSPSLSAAYGPGFASDVSLRRVPWGAAALFFDRQFGLLSVGPVWALALPGFALLAARRTGDALRAALLGAAPLLVGSAFSMWWGGSCPPARFVVPALPALAVALAPALGARRDLAAALVGLGAGIVALAAEAPRAIHNRADGESGLLRLLAPAVDLDPLLPSFVAGDARALVLAVSLVALLALAWSRGPKGLAAGAIAYWLVAAALLGGPAIDPARAGLDLLWRWDATNTLGVTGPLDVRSLRIPFELPRRPWRFAAGEIRNTRRIDLPPGAYAVVLGARVLDAEPTARLVSLDLTAGDLLLERVYLREDEAPRPVPLLLPVGARRFGLTAVGIQGRAEIEGVWVAPREVVPLGGRGELPWPRLADEGRYRVERRGVRVTVLDRSQPDGDGFLIDGEEGRFLVDCAAHRHVEVSIERKAPSPRDVLAWAGRDLRLGPSPSLRLLLPSDAGLGLAGSRLIPVRLRSGAARIALAGAPNETSAASPRSR